MHAQRLRDLLGVSDLMTFKYLVFDVFCAASRFLERQRSAALFESQQTCGRALVSSPKVITLAQDALGPSEKSCRVFPGVDSNERQSRELFSVGRFEYTQSSRRTKSLVASADANSLTKAEREILASKTVSTLAELTLPIAK